MTRLAALLLAAGFSSRMGRFKPLLPLAGEPALARIVRSFRAAGVDEIFVVVGHRADELSALCRELRVRPVANPDFAAGMFSSVCAGMRALPLELDAFFLLPVDIPLVRPATLRLLAEDFKQHRALVTYPAFAGERGHPPLLARELAQAVLLHSGQGGLRELLDQYEHDARNVAVADQGVLLDMDQPEDYARLLARAKADYPLDEECEALFEICETPDQAREHSRVVARAAERLARELNRTRNTNQRLDMALVRSAALVHDIAKGRPDHARTGAKLLLRHGFPAAADIVAVHPDLEIADGALLGEKELVFLADKFVQGTRITPMVDRYLAKLERYGDDPLAAEAIRQRLFRAESVLLRYCAETNVRLPELLLSEPE